MTGPTVWHPFTQHGLDEDIPEIVRAEGAVLYSSDGREFIDGIASWWVNTHGHAHPKIAAAIAKQARQLDQVIFAGFTHPPARQLASDLGDVIPAVLSHVFFSDSGSTAVEVALKMALGYWHNIGQPRSKIIVMEHSYHGDTIGTMSVGARGVFNAPYASLLFDVATIPFARGDGASTLDALQLLCADRDNPPAALIVEPLVSGAGGMMMYPPEILSAMARICADQNVPFIADEVMTGWGRTGSMFACEQANVVPDIMCLSKGLTGGAVPLAVTVAQKRFFDAHYSQDKRDMFFHSSSYTANPTACAAAVANLEIWREEPVQARIDTIISGHAAIAFQLAQQPHIRNLRQCGTILAMEIVDPGQEGEGGYVSSLGPQLMRYFLDQGCLLRPLGNTVYIMPPYCITQEQLHRLYEAIMACGNILGQSRQKGMCT